MARDYERKLARMRVYSKTPAGIAAIARARANTQIKRGLSTRTKKIKPQALLKALANWTQT